ncbi:alpha/beta fold hydrolase [Peptoniphilus stercorisuis]|uniref:Pimeloyl-ACP methyl ester carboxylesterase n=1 Tax=Peptoniphilus stercorisuis TaxID=1436965 RepID=A0ABS4KFG6_9FIRM|nr:alpha/beta hydrolase [Peptoniphilus stercorisuis]MBP2025891.1 pimeloyl-ACP methyl ester carboxylesterase [Peptoniphilus stercorisuis]
MEKKDINLLGTNIKYIELGDEGGRPLVVLHGWGANIESIMPIVNSIPKGYKIYAYDAPGFGDSDEPKSALSTWDYELYLEEFLEKKNIGKATFIGHSFGGKTLSIFAAKNKDKVEKLVLIDASGVIPKRTFSYYFKVYIFKFLRFLYTKLFFWNNNTDGIKKFYEKFGSDDYQASQGVMRETFVKVVNESTEECFKDIDAETLLVWGELDDATPVYMAKVFESKIKNSGLVVFEKAGHFSYIDDYGTFSAVINSFLD